jgi:hypothetical protein
VQDGLKGQAPGLFLLNAKTHVARLFLFFVFVFVFFAILYLEKLKQIIELNQVH